MTKATDIHPIFQQSLSRHDKEKQLKQKAKVIWFTGLSGSGKSTLALALEKALYQKGFCTQLLDGDNVRTGINNNLGFSEADRLENIRRIAEISKLFIHSGIICINSFVSPTEDVRLLAREIIGEEDYLQVYVKASVELCEQRDVKGLYKKARKGEISHFTGISAPFDEPKNNFLTIDTGVLSEKEALDILLKHILPVIQY